MRYASTTQAENVTVPSPQTWRLTVMIWMLDGSDVQNPPCADFELVRAGRF
jgi:hypothetical protein